MSNKKQTAVKWLEEQIIRFHNWKLNPIYDENCFDEIELDKAIKQAKEMEKQQAESIWKASDENMHRQFSSSAYKPITFEQFYNETYENNL